MSLTLKTTWNDQSGVLVANAKSTAEDVIKALVQKYELDPNEHYCLYNPQGNPNDNTCFLFGNITLGSLRDQVWLHIWCGAALTTLEDTVELMAEVSPLNVVLFDTKWKSNDIPFSVLESAKKIVMADFSSSLASALPLAVKMFPFGSTKKRNLCFFKLKNNGTSGAGKLPHTPLCIL